MKENLKKKILEGKSCFGMYVSLTDPSIIEMAALAGYDFVRIDWEHSMMNQETIFNMIRVANLVSLPVFVRVSSLDGATRLLDAGVTGIMVPHVSSREKAIEAVNEIKYAPLGGRGMYGSAPALEFGNIKLGEFCKYANDEVFIVAQIEDKEGVENIDEILSVEGIDMVATGKNDLSQSYGHPGEPTHPEVLAAEARVIQKGLEYGKIPTLLCNSKARVEELEKMGAHCFMTGRDVVFLFNGMKKAMETYKG